MGPSEHLPTQDVDRATPLRSLTYVSSATDLLTGEQLLALLESVRPRNAELELSGMLLYSGGNIIQVLEGPSGAVEETFAQIRRDPRHHDVIVLVDEAVQERAFPEWTMGFRDVGPRSEGLRQRSLEAPGINHVLAGGEVVPESGDADGTGARSAVRLLETFRRNMR